jgi:hypothetical protein
MKDECDAHHKVFAGKQHMDGMHDPGMGYDPEHKRAGKPPAHHTKGKLPAQLNIDHGPHHSTR